MVSETDLRMAEIAEEDEESVQWRPPDGTPDGRPFVTVHYAQTLDGRIATRTGDSQWISGGASLRLAHRLRAAHDAVMVGVGTILADNPRLTVRYVPGQSPLRVVVDSMLRLPLGSEVLADGAAETLVATTEAAPSGRLAEVQRPGVEVIRLRNDGDGRVDLDDLLGYLAHRDVASVLVEGGRGLITSALRHNLVDRYVVCVSAKLVGDGIEAVGDLGIQHLSDAMTFAESRFARLGEDLIFDGWLRQGRRSGG